MPNRILRDWTDSDKVNVLDAYAERFFTRILMKADDYGCYYADTRLLKANLFPLMMDEVREADISRWTAACQKAGLIVLYEVNRKRYLQVVDFKQRLDKAKAKFPLPSSGKSITKSTDFPVETETETETESETRKEAETTPPLNFLDDGLIWNIESDLLANKREYDSICHTSYQKPAVVSDSLKKYHLYLEEKQQYPKARKALYSGFKRWLMNEKPSKSSSESKSSGPSAREIEEAENRKKMGMQ